MRTCLSFVFAILIVSVSVVRAQQAVYIVRHAERVDGSHDSPISSKGETRAEQLAYMLSAADLETIYVTEFRRTQQTAAPLAQRLNLEPVIVPSPDTETLVRKIRSHGDDEAILVVGHGNTIPAILETLGYDNEIRLGGDEYDNLFVLVPRENGDPVLVRFRY